MDPAIFRDNSVTQNDQLEPQRCMNHISSRARDFERSGEKMWWITSGTTHNSCLDLSCRHEEVIRSFCVNRTVWSVSSLFLWPRCQGWPKFTSNRSVEIVQSSGVMNKHTGSNRRNCRTQECYGATRRWYFFVFRVCSIWRSIKTLDADRGSMDILCLTMRRVSRSCSSGPTCFPRSTLIRWCSWPTLLASSWSISQWTAVRWRTVMWYVAWRTWWQP